MTQSPDEAFPENDDRMFGYTTSILSVGVVASLIPGLGPIISPYLQEIAKELVQDPLKQRQIDWYNQVLAAVKNLEHWKGAVGIENKEELTSTILQVTPLAVKTHHEAKRKLFENVVLNAAVGVTLDEVLKGTFIDLLDRFSPAHIITLRILADPMMNPTYAATARSMMMGGKMNALYPALAQEGVSSDLADIICGHLIEAKLITNSLSAMMTGDGVRQPSTTQLGTAFLAYITAPSMS